MQVIKKAIITGATSFIGQALVKKLSISDVNVIGIIRPNSLRRNQLPQGKGIKYIELELEYLKYYYSEMLENSDILYHLGWYSDYSNPRYNLKMQFKNVEYTEGAIELAKKSGCSIFIGTGSQAECGRVNTAIAASTPDNPESAYAQAKCKAYKLSLNLCEKYGIRQCWPRILSAYGPNDKSKTLIMTCINACLNHKDITLTPCNQIWDYVYVDDVAQALIDIGLYGRHSIKYTIASGEARPLKEYIEIIGELTNYKKITQYIGTHTYDKNQVMYLAGDITETILDTGFSPSVKFEDGIKNTIKQLQVSKHENK